MKYLIVNADEFGTSYSINRGIIEAHKHGIVTSASLLVGSRWSKDAAALSRTVPDLSVGLHVHISSTGGDCMIDFRRRLREELNDQFSHFQELMDRPPTHIDSHHNIHRNPEALPEFIDFAQQYNLPLREYSSIRYLSKFYGQRDGQTDVEQISIENLMQILEAEVNEGITEMSCHPGFADIDLTTRYSLEREIELRTLCDPLAKQGLIEQSIQLINYCEYAALVSCLV